MRALANLANRVKSLNVNDMIMELARDKTFTDFIIELNTRKQLFDKGLDSKNRLLSDIGGEYSQNTINGTQRYKGKLSKGLPTDRITLFDEGDFYKSWRVYLDSNYDFLIEANTIKTDFDGAIDLMDRWGKDILGLNEDSLTLLRLKAKLILIPYVKKIILTR